MTKARTATRLYANATVAAGTGTTSTSIRGRKARLNPAALAGSQQGATAKLVATATGPGYSPLPHRAVLMGAETTVYVRVIKTHDEWIEVQAVTLDDAIKQAERLPGVVHVREASYIPGGVVT